jgi:hypothetical protein
MDYGGEGKRIEGVWNKGMGGDFGCGRVGRCGMRESREIFVFFFFFEEGIREFFIFLKSG